MNSETDNVDKIRQNDRLSKKEEGSNEEETIDIFDKAQKLQNKLDDTDIKIIKTEKPTSKNDEKHHDVLSRILFIYAKLNPGVRYVQGMNELLAPIYFALLMIKILNGKNMLKLIHFLFYKFNVIYKRSFY